MVEGSNVPASLASIVALPGSGVHPDECSAAMPVEDIGSAEEPITQDLTGRAALVQRDGRVYFCEKLDKAARAGAALAVVYNHVDATSRIVMGGIDFVPIPAVMVSQLDGEALRSHLQANPGVRLRLQFQPVRFSFDVRETLVCEHVGVRVDTDHSRRAICGLRRFRMGTRSVLQAVNTDDSPGPEDWTYYSTHHFFESSAGTWTVEIGDEDDGGEGSVRSVSLLINGVAIVDFDHDGLDDAWERQYFQTLAETAKTDPTRMDSRNAREQVMRTDPTARARPSR
jgi:subtilisin-like proprotein convertase family protein